MLGFGTSELDHLFWEGIKLNEDVLYFLNDFPLLLFGVFNVTQSLLLEVTLEEKTFYIFELEDKFIKLLIIVLFDVVYLVSHATELVDLGFNFLVEQAYFIFKIVDLKLIKHHNVLAITMLA